MSSLEHSLASRFTKNDVIAARRELARRNVGDFACMVDIPTVPLTDESDEDSFSVMKLNKLADHHALLCSKLQDVEAGRIPNLMILMPPGSAKSTYTDVVFIPWFMAKKPRRNVILASYASEIAEKQGRRARQLINSQSFHNLMQMGLRSDQKAAHQWTLENGSEFMAGGLLSGLTGNRGALGVVDDPMKGRAEAESETIRDKTWNAYIDDFCSRLIPGAPQIMILTRWHEDDLAGRILPKDWDGESGMFNGRDGRKWEVLCLPAEAHSIDDPLGRKIGETLWPEWFSAEHWKPFKQNARTWSSLYQQKPAPQQGTFFQKQWFKRYRKGSEPKHLNKYMTSDHAPEGGEKAAEKGEESDSDFNCARIWGVDEGGDLYLLDGFREQCRMDIMADRIIGDKKNQLVGLIQRHKPFAWFPEDDNNWKASAGFMRRMMVEQGQFVRIEPISPHGANKATKAQPFQAMAASGRVWIPEGPEGDDIISQYLKFPAGKHDDEVDAASLIGRAINDAHPAFVPIKEKKAPYVDRWYEKFEADETGEEDWKTA